MTKTASNSQKFVSSATRPQQKMVLRTRRKQNSMKEVSESEEEEEREWIPNRPKSAFKKKTQKKNKNKKIDFNKPKKPPTAFFFFLEDFRKGYQEENPEVKSMRHIGKACGEKWKTMAHEEKVKYYDIATEQRAEFDRAMAEYVRKQESGDDAESEDSESEFDDL